MRSLRTQITVGAVLVVAIVVAVAGVIIAARIDHQDRAQVDRQLRERAVRVQQDERKAAADGKPVLSDNAGPSKDSTLLVGTDTVTRILEGTQVIAQRGEGIPDGAQVPVPPGLSTVTIDGGSWRSLVEPSTTVPGQRVQLLQSLEPVEERLTANGRLTAIVGVLATVVTALAGWMVAGLLLRPLARLQAGARTVRPGTHERLPDVRRPQEIAELSETLNTMLDRLQTSMSATRRFTADAGHELRTPLTGLGMDLETLSRTPEPSSAQREEILAAMRREHRRTVTLLEGLQRLARGDAEALPGRGDVDVGAAVQECVAAAQQRHPEVAFRVEVPALAVRVEGWPDGLRLAVTNLLDNAALHGRPAGAVDVAVVPEGPVVRLCVCDDGPGIPRDQRARMLERFARGDTTSPGSGLGLSLVEQQAHLHGGELRLDESPAGGLCASVRLPISTHRS